MSYTPLQIKSLIRLLQLKPVLEAYQATFSAEDPAGIEAIYLEQKLRFLEHKTRLHLISSEEELRIKKDISHRMMGLLAQYEAKRKS